MKLFSIELEGLNVPEKTEYLKAKSKKIIENMLYQANKIPTSDYYGYTSIKVTEIDEVPVAELRTITINLPDESFIKKLENKLVYHSKSITSIKNKIRELRGDYDNPEKYNFIFSCKKHDSCSIYKKIHSPKIVHRKESPYNTEIKCSTNIFNTLGLRGKFNDLGRFTSFRYNNVKLCFKPIITCNYVGCNVATYGDCTNHYKCNICNNTHMTKKEVKRLKLMESKK